MEKTLSTQTRKELRSIWDELSIEEQVDNFKKLSAVDAGRFFAELDAREQAKIAAWQAKRVPSIPRIQVDCRKQRT